MIKQSIVAMMLTGSVAHANTVTLNPDRDNTLIESATGALSNARGDIYVSRTNQPAGQAIRRGVIHFNLTSTGIPAGSTINSVTVKLWLNKTIDATARNISLHKSTASWGEGTSYQNGGMGSASTTNDATWIHRFWTVTSWAAAGGDYNGAASATTSVGSTFQYYSWSSATLKTDVTGWIANAATNLGWEIVSAAEGIAPTARRFTSRESLDDPGNHYPQLIIDYTPPGGFRDTTTATPAPRYVEGLRVLGESDVDGDGVTDLLLRDERKNRLYGGHHDATGLQTWELVFDRTASDPLSIKP